MKYSLKAWIKRTLLNWGCFISINTPGKVAGFYFLFDISSIVKGANPVCLDVGANKGQSIESFQKVFKNPRIYSFEPALDLYKYLKETFESPTVSIYNFALGDKPESKEFLNYRKSGFNSFLELDNNDENRFSDMPVLQKEMVEIRTIDDFIELEKIESVELLKIDTQGFDLQVLKGASKSLKSGLIKNVFVEVNFIKMYKGQSNALDVFDFMFQNGFNLVDLYEKSYYNKRMAWCTVLFSIGNQAQH